MEIVILPPELVLKHWAAISSLLEKAIDKGQSESTLTDHMRNILNNTTHCWVIGNNNNNIVGAALTQVIQYAQYKTLHIIAFAGKDFKEQSKVFPTVEKFAKQMGCKAIEQWGRPGWAKELPKYVPGFKQAYVVMRKDLEGTYNEQMENK